MWEWPMWAMAGSVVVVQLVTNSHDAGVYAIGGTMGVLTMLAAEVLQRRS